MKKTTKSRSRAVAIGAICVAYLVQSPSAAMAGMPSIGFSDVIRPRLEVVSFFLIVMLVSAGIVCGLWNWLRSDFQRLPRLTYAKSLGIVTLWGLLFVVVLTMISGARELMTPGAWERDGITYKLRSTGEDTLPQADSAEVRRRSIESLAAELKTFAKSHDGRFPSQDEFGALPSSTVEVTGVPGLKYAYVPGLTEQGDATLLAFEPVIYGDDPYALFTDGAIRRVSYDEIDRPRAGHDEVP
jgi:hypothetical protein